jgi:hypothetical protein
VADARPTFICPGCAKPIQRNQTECGSLEANKPLCPLHVGMFSDEMRAASVASAAHDQSGSRLPAIRRPIRTAKRGDRMARWNKRPIVRLTREGAQIVHELRARFEQKFGRAPGPGDAVSFPVEVDAAGAIDQDRFDAALVEAMEAAGVGGAIIHAYRRTGMLVTEHNVRDCSRIDLRRWQAALEEYEEPLPQPA